MPTIPILTVNQRTEDGLISLNSNISNPLILLDLLNVVQRQLIIDAQTKMEIKKEAELIKGETSKLILT